MKKLKVSVLLLIIFLILASFAACGGSNESGDKTSSEQSKLAENVNNIFKSGTYQMSILMEIAYEGNTQNMDMTIAVNNNEMAGKMAASGTEFRFVLKENRYYMIYDEQKMLMSMEVDSSIVEIPDFTDFGNKDFSFTKTSKVNVDGKSLTCEEYDLADGSVKYYFDGNNLVRIETISGSVTQAMQVKEIKGTVDDVLFKIPSDYEEISM